MPRLTRVAIRPKTSVVYVSAGGDVDWSVRVMGWRGFVRPGGSVSYLTVGGKGEVEDMYRLVAPPF